MCIPIRNMNSIGMMDLRRLNWEKKIRKKSSPRYPICSLLCCQWGNSRLIKPVHLLHSWHRPSPPSSISPQLLLKLAVKERMWMSNKTKGTWGYKQIHKFRIRLSIFLHNRLFIVVSYIKKRDQLSATGKKMLDQLPDLSYMLQSTLSLPSLNKK